MFQIKHLNVHVFNMITGKNELNILTEHIHYKRECIFYRIIMMSMNLKHIYMELAKVKSET